MQSYRCPHCSLIFSEADKAWDIAIDSGRCPECLELIHNFPVPVREETLPPIKISLAPPKPSESRSPQQPTQLKQSLPVNHLYPWRSVLGWVSVAFLVGLVTARPTWKPATPMDRAVLGAFVGAVYAVITLILFGGYRYFCRNPRNYWESHEWEQVSVEEARIHPLYGIRGWLALFAFSILFGFLKDLAHVNAEALSAGTSIGKLLSLDRPEASFLKLVLWVRGLIVVPIYWLLFSKSPSFRPVSIYLLLGVWPFIVVAGLFNPFQGLGSLLAQGFLEWGIFCAVWVTYLHRSKRVRITFEHALSVVQSLEGTSPNSSPDSNAISKSPDVPIHAEASQPTIRVGEDLLYAKIAEELEANGVDKGLWTKVYAQAGGDDRQTRVLYIKARFERLLAAENARLNPKLEP